MRFLYVAIFAVAIVVGAWFGGTFVAREKCRATMSMSALTQQQEIITKIGEVNAETYHTGAADIRRMLRDRYTIAE